MASGFALRRSFFLKGQVYLEVPGVLSNWVCKADSWAHYMGSRGYKYTSYFVPHKTLQARAWILGVQGFWGKIGTSAVWLQPIHIGAMRSRASGFRVKIKWK